MAPNECNDDQLRRTGEDVRDSGLIVIGDSPAWRTFKQSLIDFAQSVMDAASVIQNNSNTFSPYVFVGLTTRFEVSYWDEWDATPELDMGDEEPLYDYDEPEYDYYDDDDDISYYGNGNDSPGMLIEELLDQSTLDWLAKRK